MVKKFIFAVVWLALVGGMALTGCSTDDNPVAEEEGSDGGWPPSDEGKEAPMISKGASFSVDNIEIGMDGALIIGRSVGYNYVISAKYVQFENFKCYLDKYNRKMIINEDVTIEIKGGRSEIHANPGIFSSKGTVKLKASRGDLALFADEEEKVKQMAESFSAAEGYKISETGVSDAENGEKCIAIKVGKL